MATGVTIHLTVAVDMKFSSHMCLGTEGLTSAYWLRLMVCNSRMRTQLSLIKFHLESFAFSVHCRHHEIPLLFLMVPLVNLLCHWKFQETIMLRIGMNKEKIFKEMT